MRRLICYFLGHKWNVILKYQKGYSVLYLLAGGVCSRCGAKKNGLYSDFSSTGTMNILENVSYKNGKVHRKDESTIETYGVINE